MPRPLLLAFFAHPDDEAFSCAGTLAAATSSQIDVTVVCATRGERGQARDGLSGADLGARRTQELARSCEVIGAGAPVFLDLADGDLAANREPLKSKLVDYLRRCPCDAAVTMGPDGAYGHLDHVVCTEVLAEVVGALSPGPTVLHTVFPPGLFGPLRRRLERASVPLAPPVEPESNVDYFVDIRPYKRHKLASIGAHRSQLAGDDARSFLVRGIVDRLLEEERFRHAAGPTPSGALARLLTGA